MKVLYLEDHKFFASEILEYLKDDLKLDVTYVDSWESVKTVLNTNVKFDISILDVLLKNGKTGFHVAQQWEKKLGRILFITGCIDEVTLNSLKKYSSINKTTCVWNPLKKFIDGEVVHA